MAIVSGALLTNHSKRIQEIINRSLDLKLQMLDPVTRNSVLSSQGVSQSGIGRDLEIIKTYREGMSGVIDGGRVRRHFTMFGQQQDAVGSRLNFFDTSDLEVFPSGLSGPRPQVFDIRIPLYSDHTNLVLDIGDLQLDALPATIGNQVADIIEGFSQNLARKQVNSFWLDQSQAHRLCAIGSIVDSTDGQSDDQIGSTGWYRIKFTPDNDAVLRFETGMRVDIWHSSLQAAGSGGERLNDTSAGDDSTGDQSQTPSTRIECIVETVDAYANEVTLVTDTVTTSWQQVPAANDQVLYANTVFDDGSGNRLSHNVAGFYSWAKPGGTGANNNTLLGDLADGTKDINVDTHPRFKSFFYDANSAPLTEDLLLQVFQTFHRANDIWGQSVDTMIATSGVWHAYWQQMIPQFRRAREGRASSMGSQGVNGEFSISVGGRNYTGATSDWLESGRLVALKARNNWTRYVPPSPQGARRSGNVDPGVPFEFLGNILGGNGDKLPVWVTDATASNSTEEARLTSFVQMPGHVRQQFVPDQTAAIVLKDLQDTRLASNV